MPTPSASTKKVKQWHCVVCDEMVDCDNHLKTKKHKINLAAAWNEKLKDAGMPAWTCIVCGATHKQNMATWCECWRPSEKKGTQDQPGGSVDEQYKNAGMATWKCIGCCAKHKQNMAASCRCSRLPPRCDFDP